MESKSNKIFINSPYTIKDILDNQATIINPLTGFNTAKSAFRISEVAEYFAIIVDYLNFVKIRFDKNNLPKHSNIVFDMLQNCN